MKRVIILLSLWVLSVSAFSQVPVENEKLTCELTGDDFINVTALIKRMVKNFQRDVGRLAGNEYTHNQKVDIRNKALVHFIGKGERYQTAVPTRDGFDTIWHNAVVMGSAPTKKNTKMRKYEPLKNYLSRLISNSEDPNYLYKKVVIEGAEVVTLDNFREIGNGSYIATAHILQKFTGYYSVDMVRASYQDYTKKTITIFIDFIETETHDGGSKHYWQVKLGDVDCDDVW